MKNITRFFFFALGFAALIHCADAQTINALPYSKTDNFNTYNPTSAGTATSTIPSGWSYSSTAAAYNGQSTGAGNTGGFYSYGTGGDFSLGALASGSNTHTYTVSFTNSSGATITSLTLSWDYEQWRYGTGNTSGWNCTGTGQLAANATLNGKDFSGVANGTNGTVAVTPVSSFTLSGLNITNGQTFGITWVTTNLSGTDNGVSIDNFSISASAAAAPSPVFYADVVTPGSATINQGDSQLITISAWDENLTETAGANANISAWVGYSATDTNPNTASWTWVSAAYLQQNGIFDEYTASVGSGLPAGTYYYASRFQNSTSAFTYGGLNGIWSNDSGVLTINGPEMDVKGNTVSIADGDTTPASGDHTDFGSVGTAGENLIRTFTIENTGTSALTLGSNAVTISGAGASAYTVNVQPATSVAASGSTTFQVTFDPSAAGAANAVININNNDFNENPYNFNITGTGVLPDYISISAFSTPVTENFNSMGTAASATIPVGFGIQNGLGSTVATTTGFQLSATPGAAPSGGTYNFGQNGTTDRALGFIFSGSYSNYNILAKVRNTTGSSISTFSMTFNYEQYRRNAGAQTFKLQYSTSMTSGWVDVPNGVFTNMVAGTPEAYNFTTLMASQAITLSYTPAVAVANNATVYFRWILSGTTHGVAIDDFSIQACTPPTLTVSANQNICAGTQPAGMTVSGFGSGTIQWQSSTDNLSFSNIGGATSATLTGAQAGTLNATRYFRARITNSCGVYDSPSITVSVDPAAVGGTIAGSTTVCGTTNGGTLTLSGQTGSVIQWESSTNNFSTAGTVIANTTNTLNYSNVMVQTWYRVLVQSGDCQAYSSVAVIGIGTSTTWDGSSWSNGEPDGSKALIVTGDLALADQFFFVDEIFACSVTVSNGATLTVNNGYDLNVNGAVTVDSGSNLILQNNGNLLQTTDVSNSGSAYVYRLSSALMRLDYTLWSSPVDAQNLFAFSPMTVSTRFYTYNSTSNLYNSVNPTATNFAEGKGYLIRMPDNHELSPTNWTGEFIGVPHNGPVNVALNNISATQRFNLVGNPYPSPIDLNQFVSDNEDDITGTLYFWRKTNNEASPSYCTWSTGGFVTNGEAEAYDPLGVLQTGQGFLVEASATGTTLNFNNGQRIGNNDGQFFRMAEGDRHRIWLNASNADGAFSQTLIGYYPDATNGVDNGLDGKYMNDGPIALTSLIDAVPYAIQGRPAPFTDSDVVTLNFKATTAGNYTISLDHFDGLFDEGQDIYLRDNATGIVHDLHLSGYEFASEAGEFAARFEVIYNNSLAIYNPTFNENSVIVYNQNGNLVINSGAATMKSVQIFDTRGRLIVEKNGINATETTIDAGLSNQVLIVKITSDNNETVTKKAVN